MPADSSTSARIMHTMIRVGDLDRAVRFYCDNFGMQELSRSDVPEGRYTNVFVGYGDIAADPMIELTYNYDQDAYEIGTGFGHIAIGVKDIYGTCEKLRASGVTITREPGPLKFGTVLIAFVRDPDGYVIELIDVDSTN